MVPIPYSYPLSSFCKRPITPHTLSFFVIAKPTKFFAYPGSCTVHEKKDRAILCHCCLLEKNGLGVEYLKYVSAFIRCARLPYPTIYLHVQNADNQWADRIATKKHAQWRRSSTQLLSETTRSRLQSTSRLKKSGLGRSMLDERHCSWLLPSVAPFKPQSEFNQLLYRSFHFRSFDYPIRGLNLNPTRFDRQHMSMMFGFTKGDEYIQPCLVS